MTTMASSLDSEGEILTPTGYRVAEPEQPARPRTRGRNLFAAPATYILVAINVAVLPLDGLPRRPRPKSRPSRSSSITEQPTPDFILAGQWWRPPHRDLRPRRDSSTSRPTCGACGTWAFSASPCLAPWGSRPSMSLTGVAGQSAVARLQRHLPASRVGWCGAPPERSSG